MEGGGREGEGGRLTDLRREPHREVTGPTEKRLAEGGQSGCVATFGAAQPPLQGATETEREW